MDTIANGLTTIVNSEIRRMDECIISPSSKLLGNVLRVFQIGGYIGEFEFIDDGRSGKMRIQLLGRIYKCAAIRPRFSVKVRNIEEWEKIYLPAREIGVLVISTPEGIMSHREAKNRGIGGSLLAYVY